MRGRGKSKPHVFLTNWASVLCQQFQELLTLDLGPPGLQQRESAQQLKESSEMGHEVPSFPNEPSFI